jgi:hypothetical protein
MKQPIYIYMCTYLVVKGEISPLPGRGDSGLSYQPTIVWGENVLTERRKER